MGVKILAEGSRPLRYWTGPESSINTFDSSIVVLSFALMGAHGAGEAILPVLRLARLIKLLNRSAETRRVLYGIIAGFKAMASIVVLLGLIMFLYAIIGVKSFGENDPAHFGTVPIAMLTLFVASTCSDWSHMLQINYKGCDKGGGDWGYERADRLTQFETMVGRFYNYDCHDPTPRKLDAILFFYSYTMLTAFVVLNLFISAIDMAMFDILYADQVEAHEDHIEADPNHEPPPIVDSSKIAARDRGGGGDDDDAARKRRRQRASIAAAAGLGVSPDYVAGHRKADREAVHERAATVAETAGGGRRFRGAVKGALHSVAHAHLEFNAFHLPHGMGQPLPHPHPKTALHVAENLIAGDERETFAETLDLLLTSKVERNRFVNDDDNTLGSMRVPVSLARAVCQSKLFPVMVIFCIVAAGVVEALSVTPSEPVHDAALRSCEAAILAVFLFEAVLKILACGRAPYRYCADGGNVFDFLILIISVLGMIPHASKLLPGVAMLRLLRLLKLVNFYPALHVAVSSLLKASSNVFYATVVLALVVYVYAVIGMLVFRVNDPGHFGNLAQAVAAVWAVCTMDGWDVIMYVNMYGCSRFGYPFNDVPCRNSRAFGWVSAFYFCSLILIGAWMLPTVIIGITTIALRVDGEIKEEYVQLAIGQKAVNKAADLFDQEPISYEVIDHLYDLYRRLAEEQVKAKLVEYKIHTTKQHEANAGLRWFTMRPFLQYVVGAFETNLAPEGRRRPSKARLDRFVALACGVKDVDDASRRRSTSGPPSTDLDGEEESDEEEAPPPAKADRVSKARFGKGWRKKAKGWFGGDEEAKDSTTIELGAVSDKVAEEVEELEGEAGAAVSGLETGLESASTQLGDLVREKVIPEFVVDAAEDPYKHLTPVSPDPQVFCGGFLSPVSDGARDDSNVDCSTDGPFAFFTSNMEAYPPLTDGAGSPVAPKAETPKPKKKKKPKPSKKRARVLAARMSDMVGGAYGVAALAATGAAVAAGAYALWRRARRKADAEASAAFRRRKSVEKPWQESQKKGTNSYYYGHHTPARSSRISQYSWSQTDDQIKICVEPSGWNFATIAAEDVSVELTSPTSLALVAYDGATTLACSRAPGKIAKLAWKKTKKRLVITLDKQDNVLGWDKSGRSSSRTRR
ncbi:low voltage-gated calcium channel [Aureococcus anophagefferens]|nr:low voltage-gated calcium channel [Aureococcus anophagefferens]